jgi:hypothetical protein
MPSEDQWGRDEDDDDWGVDVDEPLTCQCGCGCNTTVSFRNSKCGMCDECCFDDLNYDGDW